MNIDYEALVQDGVDDVSEAAGRAAVEVTVAKVGYGGHEKLS